MEEASLEILDLELVRFDLDRAERSSLFEVLRYLERAIANAPPIGALQDPSAERVRMRASISMDFPSSDIESIEITDEDRVLITTTFMGLVGSSSPLPLAYSNRVSRIRDEHAAERLRAFLDVFHNRLLALLYRAWKRHLLDPGDASAGVLRALLTLGGISMRHADRPFERTAEAQVQMYHARTATGLERLLRRELGYKVELRPLSRRMTRLRPRDHCSSSGRPL